MASVDFLPEDYLIAKRRTRTNLLCFALFVIVMLGIVWAFVVNQQMDANVAVDADEVNASIAAESRKLARMHELDRKKRSMLEKAEMTGQLLQRVPRSLILAELTNAMPKQCSWLRWELSSIKPKRPSPRGMSRLQARRLALQAARQSRQLQVKLIIEGLSPTDLEVSNFMGAIKKCPLFGNVNLISTVEHKVDEEILRRFKVEVTLAADAQNHVKKIASEQRSARDMLGADPARM